MSPRGRARLTFWVLLAISLFTMVFTNLGYRSALQALPMRLIGRAQGALSAVGRSVVNTIRSVRELQDLRSDYRGLLEQVEEYAQLESYVVDLEIENAALRQQLEFSDRLRYEAVAARVIAKEPGSLDGGITINRGEERGVRVGMSVVAYIAGQEGLVGRIAKTAPGVSVVQPIHAPNSYIAARLQRERYEGLVSGTGDVNAPIRMLYVPSGARDYVRYGDVVVTSGNNSIFPPELRIGLVREIEAPGYEPSIQLTLEPIVDFARIEYVFVLLVDSTLGIGGAQ